MKPTAGPLRAVALASALAVGPAAWACGYHDAGSINRGILNWVYPNALYVTSAVWRAQLEGLIPREELPAPAKVLVGYGRTIKKLGVLMDGLSKARGDQSAPAFSFVLIGPMLWTRFEPTQSGLIMTSHATGPSSGDVVIVTDEPVLRALADGQVSPQAAREMGLIRLYGPPDGVQAVTAWFDRLPALGDAAPLETAQKSLH